MTFPASGRSDCVEISRQELSSRMLYTSSPADRQWQPARVVQQPQLHVNVLCASLAVGGAERCVHDVVTALERAGIGGKLFVLHEVHPSYAAIAGRHLQTIPLSGVARDRRLEVAALEVLASPSRVLITHLIRGADLQQLWRRGIVTIPVIHNSTPGWHDRPETYDHPQVPFIVAVCESVAAQLRDAGCTRPIVVLRHELVSRTTSLDQQAAHRSRIRRQYGIRDDTLLIGMVGQFKAHKAYTRAVRVLHRLQRHLRAKLMIAGGWDHAYGAGRVTYTATLRRAVELGVAPDLIVAGAVDPIEPYYAAFDVFLNTSVYEGMSIATLEAAQSGCPIVTADVGGQREAIRSTDRLVSDSADIDAYVAAIRSVSDRRERALPAPHHLDVVPRLWAWLTRYGVDSLRPTERVFDTLIVTSNLNPGGAQRSLTNVLPLLSARHRALLCTLGHTYDSSFLRQLRAADVPMVSLETVPSTLERADRVLDLAARLGVRTICFWSVDPAIKLLIAKVHSTTTLRLVDVSPGPMLFHELEQHGELQRRICLTGAQYFRRLDRFVTKYADGAPSPAYGMDAERVVCVRNGVAVPDYPSAETIEVRPPGADPALAVVTCTRIAPNKCIESLLEVARHLARLVPGATLTIVGGVDPKHVDYWTRVMDTLDSLRLDNVHFAGPHSNVAAFLPQFAAFVMLSRAQGCPNASLEAMAAGLPVVANDDGGTREQVRHGTTGVLVPGEDAEKIAEGTAWLLGHPAEARAMGDTARQHVRDHFSMTQMADGYLKALEA